MKTLKYFKPPWVLSVKFEFKLKVADIFALIQCLSLKSIFERLFARGFKVLYDKKF